MARSAEGLRSNLQKFRSCARNSGTTCASLGRARSSTSRSKRPGAWRISWNWRADVPGRAGTGRILRRPFPRREPDAGRRSLARRRALLVTSRHGNGRAKATSGNCTRAAHLRIRSPGPEELQVAHEPHTQSLAAAGHQGVREICHLPGAGRDAGHVVSRNARLAQREYLQAKGEPRSLSITIAAKGFAACADS
jgi:hypothetical protein